MQFKTTYTLQLLTAIGLILFWTAFFTIGFENPNYPSYYSKFEHRWKDYTLVAAGAMLFLGLCDFSFNIMNGMYTVGLTDGILNAFINIWCVGFGAWQMYVVMK